MNLSRKFSLACGWLTCYFFCNGVVHGQVPGWRPNKPVEIIAPSAPGGSTDATARTIQKILHYEGRTTVPINVVNKAGGNQAVALAYLNQHTGDAHYIAIANPTLNSNYITGISELRYVDVTPIALLSSEYTVFTVLASSPLKRFSDLAERLKKAPESLSIGITTRGGANHIVLCLAARAIGVDVKQLKVVPFRSNGESIAALLGGHLQLVVSTVAASIEQVRAGNARFLSIASPRRMTGTLADTPTLREEGINVAKSNWRAVVGAKKLGTAEVNYWENALRRLSTSDDWRKALETEYWTDSFATGRELTRFLEGEYAQDKTILGELGLAR